MPAGVDTGVDGSARVRRLGWLCRRGMKELDVLFERFILDHREALERGQWPELEGLLLAEDDRLWDWLQKPETAENEAARQLLLQIRNERN